MKITIALFATMAASAAAFNPSPISKHRASQLSAVSLSDLPGVSAPTQTFDPLKLSELGSAETFAWIQAAELKHARAAMLAVTGYIVQSAGIHFPGSVDGVSFATLSTLHPFEQWDQLPEIGKYHIVATIFLTELITETKKSHYMKGGNTPMIVFPPIDFSDVDVNTMKSKKTSELNNGRLAMITIIAYITNYFIEGSVPGLIP